MRAIFYDVPTLDDLQIGSLIKIEKERAHHLIKVVRINIGEKILLLSGKGHKIFCTVKSVSKYLVEVEIEDIKFCPPNSSLDLALCMPKRDAFEEVLRFAVEIGIQKIIPLYSKFSARNFKVTSRHSKVIESAIIQSNNPYDIKIEEINKFESIEEMAKNYKRVFYFTSQYALNNYDDLHNKIADDAKCLMIIGPEGGLSLQEENLIKTLNNIKVFHLPSNILKTPTAVCVASGFLMGIAQFND
ncbi:MAG: 16S rRNA (uracil(1498)-N(3))-methyltransferase [Bacteriovoracaceae bacterium]|nr:16S rRNA (uracil(1498)-N(3))-methyltransferase [Bacteriovoracaceae bacterium]